MKQVVVEFSATHISNEYSVTFQVENGYAIDSDSERYVLLSDSSTLQHGKEIKFFRVDSFLKYRYPMYCFNPRRSVRIFLTAIENFARYILTWPFCKIFGTASGMLLPAITDEYLEHYTWVGKIISISELKD